MRLKIRHPSSLTSRPCKVILVLIVVLFVLKTTYLFQFLHPTIEKKCLSRHKVGNNLEGYPIYHRQNVPTLNSHPLNWINFGFKTQPHPGCFKVDTVFVVHTKAENFDRRSFFRFHILNFFNRKRVRPLFVLFDNSALANQIEDEAKHFNDLLVVSGVDEHYHNITHKARAWIVWLSDNCKIPNSPKIVFKCDDDIQLSTRGLMELFKLFDDQKSLVLCRVFQSGQVVRNPRSKWFLDKEEYSPISLGTYCQGMAYAFSGNLLLQMVINMERVQFLWMDDWYVTHALINSTDAVYVDIGRHYVSTNSPDELATVLRRNRPFLHEPIFGHFRGVNGSQSATSIWRQIQSC